MARLKAGKHVEKEGVGPLKASLRAQRRMMASEMAKASDEKYCKAQRDIQQVKAQQG